MSKVIRKPESIPDHEDDNNDEIIDDSEVETQESNSDSETVIDLTENPLYQVLSTLLEDEEGNNLCYHLSNITLAIQENTKMMKKLLEKSLLASAQVQAPAQSSSSHEEHREKKVKKERRSE
jgi:hypothetical protein